MFGIGIVEVFIILMVVLFVIGPENLPEAARTVGRFVHTVRQYINEIKRSVHDHNPMLELQNQDEFDIPELMPNADEDDVSVENTVEKNKNKNVEKS